MKFIASVFFLLLSIASLSAQTAPVGVWNTGTDNSQVEIKQVDGSYIGTLIASDNPKAKIGKVLLKDLTATKDGWEGQLFAPKKGKWFDATLKEDGDQLLITIGSGFMSKTIEWAKE